LNGDNAETIGLAVGDLHNDNKLDMDVINNEANNIGIFLGQVNGKFSQQTRYSTGTGSSPSGLALADLNSDNILNIVVSNYATDNLFVFSGNGDGNFTQTLHSPLVIIQGHSQSLAMFVKNNIGIFFGNGTRNFAAQTTYSTGSSPYTLFAADFNRDSVLDIGMSANYLGKNTSVLRTNDDEIFGQQNTFSTSNGSFPFEYGNRNFKKQKTYSTGRDSYPDDIAVEDFNGNSQLDLISTNYITINDKSNIYSKESK
jgi:hypothetical protein